MEGTSLGQPPGSNDPFVGRLAELTTLVDHLKRTIEGRSTPILLEGDPGTGKSRLLDECATRAEALGFRTLRSTAHEFERDVPYGAVTGLVTGVIRQLGAHGVQELLGDQADDLQIVWSDSPGTGDDPVDLAARAHIAVADLLRSWASQRPLLVILDDAHWADHASCELLQVLGHRLRASHCLPVIAYRGRPPELDTTRDALFGRLETDEMAHRIVLEGLDTSDCLSLLAHIWGSPVDRESAVRIHEVTSGRPFFVHEVACALTESRAVDVIEGRATLVADTDLEQLSPPKLRNHVFRRVDGLGVAARTVLEVLAVLGSVDVRRAGYHALVEGSKLSIVAVEDALDLLVRAGLIRMDDNSTIEFAHPIVRSLTYEELGPLRRRRCHREIARSLEAAIAQGQAVGRVEVARHLNVAADIGDSHAIDVLVCAGDESLSRSPAVAAHWYARAAELVAPGDEPLRADVRLREARALLMSDSLVRATQSARDAYNQLYPGPSRDIAACVAATALSARGEMREAVEVLDQALQQSSDEGRGRLLAHRGSSLLYQGHFDAATHDCEAALETIDDDASARTLALRELSQLAFMTGDIGRHTDLVDAALREAESLPSSARALILGLSGMHRALAGDIGHAELLLLESKRIAIDRLAPWSQPISDVGLAVVSWYRGEWDTAEMRAQAAIDEATISGRVVGSAWIAPPVIFMAVDRGQIGQARQTLDDVFAAHETTGYRQYAHLLHCYAARLDRFTGQQDVAYKRLSELEQSLEEQGVVAGRCHVLWELIDTALTMGLHDKAASAAATLTEVADVMSIGLLLALSDRAQAAVHRDRAAAERALKATTTLGVPFECAQTQLVLGEALDDVDLALDAYRTFQGLAADPWRRRAGALLRRLGHPVPRQRHTTEPDELTNLESEIARLVADGRSNREVADAVYVSLRTVENYLSRIYRKTGCQGRAALAAAVASGKVALGINADGLHQDS